MKNVEIVLASQSPSRKLLFDRAGIDVEVIVSGVDESTPDTFTPPEIVEELAKRKAEAVFESCKGKAVIAADSLVSIDGEILGKPENLEKAREMLEKLSGRTHTIYTGVCIMYKEKQDVFFKATDVTFYELSKAEINAYIATGESMGKAGSYGIEGKGVLLIKEINGDYSNIVGLPLAETFRRLKKMI